MRIAYKRGTSPVKKKNTFDKKVEAFKTEFIALHNRRIEAARRKSIKELKEMSC